MSMSSQLADIIAAQTAAGAPAPAQSPENACPMCKKFSEKVTEREPKGRFPGYYCKNCGYRWELPGQEKKKCRLDILVGPTITMMLEQAPENPTVRAMLLYHTKKPVPDGMMNFFDIREWVEANFSASDVKDTAPLVVFPVSMQDTESGNCSFERIVRYRGNVSLAANQIIESLEEFLDDFDGDVPPRMLEFIRDRVIAMGDAEARDNIPPETISQNISNEDVEDSTLGRSGIGSEYHLRMAQHIMDYVSRRRHDLYNRLDPNFAAPVRDNGDGDEEGTGEDT